MRQKFINIRNMEGIHYIYIVQSMFSRYIVHLEKRYLISLVFDRLRTCRETNIYY